VKGISGRLNQKVRALIGFIGVGASWTLIASATACVWEIEFEYSIAGSDESRAFLGKDMNRSQPKPISSGFRFGHEPDSEANGPGGIEVCKPLTEEEHEIRNVVPTIFARVTT
jgi:hypothetical protein